MKVTEFAKKINVEMDKIQLVHEGDYKAGWIIEIDDGDVVDRVRVGKKIRGRSPLITSLQVRYMKGNCVNGRFLRRIVKAASGPLEFIVENGGISYRSQSCMVRVDVEGISIVTGVTSIITRKILSVIANNDGNVNIFYTQDHVVVDAKQYVAAFPVIENIRKAEFNRWSKMEQRKLDLEKIAESAIVDSPLFDIKGRWVLGRMDSGEDVFIVNEDVPSLRFVVEPDLQPVSLPAGKACGVSLVDLRSHIGQTCRFYSEKASSNLYRLQMFVKNGNVETTFMGYDMNLLCALGGEK